MNFPQEAFQRPVQVEVVLQLWWLGDNIQIVGCLKDQPWHTEYPCDVTRGLGLFFCLYFINCKIIELDQTYTFDILLYLEMFSPLHKEKHTSSCLTICIKTLQNAKDFFSIQSWLFYGGQKEELIGHREKQKLKVLFSILRFLLCNFSDMWSSF